MTKESGWGHEQVKKYLRNDVQKNMALSHRSMNSKVAEQAMQNIKSLAKSGMKGMSTMVTGVMQKAYGMVDQYGKRIKK